MADKKTVYTSNDKSSKKGAKRADDVMSRHKSSIDQRYKKQNVTSYINNADHTVDVVRSVWRTGTGKYGKKKDYHNSYYQYTHDGANPKKLTYTPAK